MNSTVIITGTAGFLGSHLLETVLRETTLNVIAVDSLRHNGESPNVRDVLDGFPSERHRVTHVAHDLRAPFGRIDLKHLVNVEYIIHAAALCQVGQSIADPVSFIDNNVRSALTMLELARLSPDLRGFILISTDEVYGPLAPQTPSDYAPSSPYAASKACQEVIASAYTTTFNVPVTTVNVSNMFGPRQSQLAFTPRVIRALHNGEGITVHTDGMGHVGGRHYAYVKDVAGHLVRYMRDVIDGTAARVERIQLPGHTYVRNDELVRLLFDNVHPPLAVKFEDVVEYVDAQQTRPGHDHSYAALAAEADWKPHTNVELALGETLTWFTAHEAWLES